MGEEIIERLPDGVIVVDRERKIALMNGAAERLTGWVRAEAVGRFYGEVLRLRDTSGRLAHEHADPFECAGPVSMGSPEREFQLHRRDGSSRWVAVRARYARDDFGRVVEVVVSVRDANRRHRLEHSAYDLIATLAHDLRSPLTSVKGFTSTLVRNWDRFTEEQKQHMLRTIDWDADRMNRLLSDLLDLSRLEAGRLELKRQSLDVPDLAKRVVDRASMDVKAHSITTAFPDEFPTVTADPGKIEQVLVNLVENAIKHGDPGPIEVSGEVVSGRIIVRVSDSGPGIDAKHVPYVFTKFYRRGTGERHSGTGLGLYICKGVIEAHGGEIRIERTNSDGTVFAFSLPREEQ
ncbi:MAG: ATP-binding protein [Actinomycetota bacterium]